MEKIWMPVRDYINYEVSNYGDVRNTKFGRILKKHTNKTGYEYITLSNGGVHKSFRIHRLVWEAFNWKIPEGMVIDHINTIRNDCRLENLRCVTPKENSNNPVTYKKLVEINRKKAKDPEWLNKTSERLKNMMKTREWRKKYIKGVRNALNKPVLQINMNTGEVIRKWECSADVWRDTGIHYSGISACCTGKRKSAGGFRWMYFMPPALIYSQQGLES